MRIFAEEKAGNGNTCEKQRKNLPHVNSRIQGRGARRFIIYAWGRAHDRFFHLRTALKAGKNNRYRAQGGTWGGGLSTGRGTGTGSGSQHQNTGNESRTAKGRKNTPRAGKAQHRTPGADHNTETRHRERITAPDTETRTDPEKLNTTPAAGFTLCRFSFSASRIISI